MKQLLIHWPENPLDFLINWLGKKDPMWIFIVGPPGSFAKSIAQGIATDFGYECINIGNIFKEEALK